MAAPSARLRLAWGGWEEEVGGRGGKRLSSEEEWEEEEEEEKELGGRWWREGRGGEGVRSGISGKGDGVRATGSVMAPVVGVDRETETDNSAAGSAVSTWGRPQAEQT